MSKFKDKVCLVTASSTGIGFGIAEKFAQEGGHVIISSRSEQHVSEAVKKLKDQNLSVYGMVVSVVKKQDRDMLFEFIKQKFGKLDVLVLNAAVSTHFGSSLDIEEKAFDKMFETNIKSTFFMAKEFCELMKTTKHANILIISSNAGYQIEKAIGIYSITKLALLGLTKLLAIEFQEYDIRVNCIAPGLIKTKFSAALWENRENELAEERIYNRIGTPNDIANAAAYLCSDDAQYVNGETLVVAGIISPRL